MVEIRPIFGVGEIDRFIGPEMPDVIGAVRPLVIVGRDLAVEPVAALVQRRGVVIGDAFAARS